MLIITTLSWRMLAQNLILKPLPVIISGWIQTEVGQTTGETEHRINV